MVEDCEKHQNVKHKKKTTSMKRVAPGNCSMLQLLGANCYCNKITIIYYDSVLVCCLGSYGVRLGGRSV